MTPLPQEKLYTYADMLAWDGDIRYELYSGVPRSMSSPTAAHQKILTALLVQFYNYLDGKRCDVYPAPLDVRLFEQPYDRPEDVDTVVQPDLMVVCDQSKVDHRGIHGAPDLIVEILSESTLKNDRMTKFKLYQDAGVREYWIIDPEKRIAAVHLLENGRYGSPIVYTADDDVAVSILDGLSVSLPLIFRGV